jgi:hypothetical protein
MTLKDKISLCVLAVAIVVPVVMIASPVADHPASAPVGNTPPVHAVTTPYLPISPSNVEPSRLPERDAPRRDRRAKAPLVQRTNAVRALRTKPLRARRMRPMRPHAESLPPPPAVPMRPPVKPRPRVVPARPPIVPHPIAPPPPSVTFDDSG